MPTLPIDDWTLHYQRLGDGPEVVLLHGLSGDLAFWHPVLLAGLASRYRLTLVDLRGHGRSGRPRSGYTTGDLARDVARLLDHLSIDAAHLIGHSFGGAVALHCAFLHPERARSLVLADARVRSLQPSQGVREWSRWQEIRGLLAAHGLEIPDDDVEPDFGLMNALARYRLEGRLEGLSLEPFFVPFAAGGPRRAAQWLALVGETTAPADFKEIAGLTPEAIRTVSCPALLLYGALSHCLPTQNALAGILSGAEARLVDGAGHFHPLVKPQAFLSEVREFLGRAGRRAAGSPLALEPLAAPAPAAAATGTDPDA